MINFHCKNCGQKFSVPEIHAGKKGKCPKCKNIILVPKIQSTSPPTTQNGTANHKAISKDSSYGLTLLDVPQKDKAQIPSTPQYDVSAGALEDKEELEGAAKIDQAEPVAERKLPWIIDIFLYPTSQAGLTYLAIFVGVPLAIRFIKLSLGTFGLAIALPSLIINILVGLGMCWYFAECVRDSACGRTRAPEAFSTADISEMFSQSLYLAACYLLFAGPAGFYFVYTQKTDAIFWLLLAYGAFFFPMALLAVVMFNSSSAFNPLLLIISIFKTLFPYSGLVAFLTALVLVARFIPTVQPDTNKWAVLALDCISSSIFIYVALVVAHLLGRFYWRYQNKLNWEV
jgi:DNA-directed RNA polymerase subunit RPC12/RpoP